MEEEEGDRFYLRSKTHKSYLGYETAPLPDLEWSSDTLPRSLSSGTNFAL